MEILVKIAQFLLSLSLLIILHEMGHFMFAKLFKTRVEKFYLFFDPWFSLFKYKKGETEYGVGWIPLGGYVKISGMIDESMDKAQMAQPPQPWEFRSKPTWQRLLIMVGGVMMNFVLAFFVYSMVLFAWGDEYLPTENAKYGIMCDSTALKMGLKNGDKILSVDNRIVEDFFKIAPEVLVSRSIQVNRNDTVMDVLIPDSAIQLMVQSKNPVFISPRLPFIVGEVLKDSAAMKAGLKKDDQVIGIDSVATPFYDQFKNEIKKHKNSAIVLAVLRGNDTLQLTAHISSSGMIGVMLGGDLSKIFVTQKVNYGFFESFPAGIKKGIYSISSYWKQLKLMFRPETKAYEQLGGFITIGKIFPGVWDWQAFWNLTAFLSIILGVMNILPIPALDGGHVLFLLYEIITGRKPSDKFLEYAQIIGMFLLFALLIYANGNDIFKLFK
jgi:regulator of sigma E protease